jgi:hypothetical protein
VLAGDPFMWPYLAAWIGPASVALVSVILAVRVQGRTAKILLAVLAVVSCLLAGLVFVVGVMSF